MVNGSYNATQRLVSPPDGYCIIAIMEEPKHTHKPKRTYRRITPKTVVEHELRTIVEGNNTASVRATEGDYYPTDGAMRQRAVRIVAKRDGESIAEYLENSLQQIAPDAITTLSEAVNSGDTRVATYVVDQLRGKAVQRNFTVSAKANIQSVLD